MKIAAAAASSSALALALAMGPHVAASRATCDLSTDGPCATVSFFAAEDTACSGEVAQTADVPLHPASLDDGAAHCVALPSGEIELQAQVCYDGNCDAMVNVRSAVGECVAVQLPGDNAGEAHAKVDVDCGAVGICAPGTAGCVAWDVKANCSAATVPTATVGRIPDGKCHRLSSGDDFYSVTCDGDGATNFRYHCNEGCLTCEVEALALQKDLCSASIDNVHFVAKTECNSPSPPPPPPPPAPAGCDPSTDPMCATVRVFAAGDSSCAGDVVQSANVPLQPASFASGGAMCSSSASGQVTVQGRVCLSDSGDGECGDSDALNLGGADGECLAVELPNGGGQAFAKIIANCRAAGVCAPGSEDCAVLHAVTNCSADAVIDPEAILGRVPDAKCQRASATDYYSVSCGPSGAIDFRYGCDADCSQCAHEALELEKDYCSEVVDGGEVHFIARTVCGAVPEAATCDPATDELCATVRFFDASDAICAGEAKQTSNVPLHPATFAAGGAYCGAQQSGELDLQVQVCYGGDCGVMVRIRGAEDECVSVKLVGGGEVRAKIDVDCRVVGVCAPGEDDCAVLDAVEDCSAASQEAPIATVGRLADGKCHRMTRDSFTVVSCNNGATDFRYNCNEDCSQCERRALGLEKDVCEELDDTVTLVARTACGEKAETPAPTRSPSAAAPIGSAAMAPQPSSLVAAGLLAAAIALVR